MNEMAFTAVENLIVFCTMVVAICGPMLAFLYGGLWIDKKTGWVTKFANEMFGIDEPNKK